ncbi:DUF6098 family protein [Amycolatopsis sp. FDAARGOS 1241]|uniref:DUF6098 family protein n=1 Tax=Amycolatopsis sp. FDAARGOS 1241 TaxID=2778070 RepID=UPI00194FC959|nr:DUF6098 family protein [Amycolatopsis sp. FDAARGOS 1241]QRP49684.1 hypothetical protein I6J71_19250 [Amycolatopsis sp. FDAARGOS 1241]
MELPTVTDLDGLAALFGREGGEDLYVRWSHGPEADIADSERAESSRDALTGAALPGLSANSLRTEPWWCGRSTRLWLARRLYDYEHLRDLRGPGVRPWVLRGREIARGPDNEPLVVDVEPLAWVADAVLHEARRLVDEQQSAEWGPLDRRVHTR